MFTDIQHNYLIGKFSLTHIYWYFKLLLVILVIFIICTKLICRFQLLRCWNKYLTVLIKLESSLTLGKRISYSKRYKTMLDKTRFQVQNTLSWQFPFTLAGVIILWMIQASLNLLTLPPTRNSDFYGL